MSHWAGRRTRASLEVSSRLICCDSCTYTYTIHIQTVSPNFYFHLIAATLRLLVHVMLPLIAFVILPSPPAPSSLSFPSPRCYYSTLGFEHLLAEWKRKILSMSISLLTLEPLNCGNWVCHTDLDLNHLTKSSAELLKEETSSSPAIYQSHCCQKWRRWILVSGQKFCSIA